MMHTITIGMQEVIEQLISSRALRHHSTFYIAFNVDKVIKSIATLRTGQSIQIAVRGPIVGHC